MTVFRSFLDYLYLAWRRKRLTNRDECRWNNFQSKDRTPRIYYGFDPLPVTDEPISGGIVKCLDLSREFPNTLFHANILYLVSSALPYNATALIRIAQQAGVRIVVNQNGVAYPAWHGPGWEKTNKVYSAILHAADYVIYQSHFCKSSVDHFLGNINVPSDILYNPVDTEVFIPDSMLKNSHELLIAGTHNHAYRVRLALETLRSLRTENTDYHLTIAGPFNWIRNSRKAMADVGSWISELELDDAVEIIGSYTQQQAVSLFQRSAFLLHVQYNDACSRLLVEAMSCGLPVVYSATGGSPEIVGEEAGIGIKLPLDYEQEHYPAPDKLAYSINEVRESYDSFQKAARERAVKKFGLNAWLERHRIIFNDLMV